MSSSRGKKTVVPALKKRKGAFSSAGPTAEIRHPLLQFPRWPQEELFQILWARPLIAGRCIDWATPTYLELTMELCSTFHLQTVMTNYDDPDMVQFCLGGLIRQLSVPEFGVALGLYTKEFKEENASYNPSRSKASVLPPSLKYLHTILAHTIMGSEEVIVVVGVVVAMVVVKQHMAIVGDYLYISK
ncbi:hypothetical protein GOBAR_AA26491 [Gossypium barbadense]|uniref:Uncharacterized protein n=1 Tax=Gossypium barbadense TaxID=3634 RepID=A0A2P5WSZ0_GOSBA|nr:hypothetical protein GOBAR_AA26491 [Gossypium barbadense]